MNEKAGSRNKRQWHDSDLKYIPQDGDVLPVPEDGVLPQPVEVLPEVMPVIELWIVIRTYRTKAEKTLSGLTYW